MDWLSYYLWPYPRSPFHWQWCLEIVTLRVLSSSSLYRKLCWLLQPQDRLRLVEKLLFWFGTLSQKAGEFSASASCFGHWLQSFSAFWSSSSATCEWSHRVFYSLQRRSSYYLAEIILIDEFLSYRLPLFLDSLIRSLYSHLREARKNGNNTYITTQTITTYFPARSVPQNATEHSKGGKMSSRQKRVVLRWVICNNNRFNRLLLICFFFLFIPHSPVLPFSLFSGSESVSPLEVLVV